MRYSNSEVTVSKEVNFSVVIDGRDLPYEIDRVDDLMELLFLLDKTPDDVKDIKLHIQVKRK